VLATAFILIYLACVDLLHLAERRHAPEREGEIYATPGTVHLRQRLVRRRATALKTVAGPALPVWSSRAAGGVRRRAAGWIHRSRSGMRSPSAAREEGTGKGSAKYWVSWVTRSSPNSITLTE
jgi:hypothetical protein